MHHQNLLNYNYIQMAVIRVTKEFHFEMAHALKNYDGLCKNIHGHSYKLYVTVMGTPISDENNPKFGMVVDFGDLKKLVKKEIVNIFDHALVLNQNSGFEVGSDSPEMFGNTVFVDYQPSCENLVADFALRIKEVLPQHLTLFSLRLYETATAFAEWFTSDN